MPDRMQEDIADKMLTWKPSGPHGPAGPAQVLGYQGTYVHYLTLQYTPLH